MVSGPLTLRRLGIVAGCAAAIVAAYAVFLLLIEQRVHTSGAFDRQPGLPLVLIGKGSAAIGTTGECILAGLTLLQASLLFYFYRNTIRLKSDRRLYVIVVICVVVMSTLSLRTTFTSSDIYHYVFYGKKISLASTYQPSSQIYSKGFEGLASAIHDNPVAPSVYGPLWQEADRLLIFRTQTLGQAVNVIRISSLVALFALFIGAGMLRTNVAEFGMVALNPGLYYAFVVQGHNDIFGILLIMAGVLCFKRQQPIVGTALLIIATAIKIIFVVVAISILRVIVRRSQRVISAVAIVLGCLALSFAFGGHDYFRAILIVGGGQASVHTSVLEHFVRYSLFGLFVVEVLVVLLVSISSGFGYRLGSLSFPGLSALLHPWYFGWGLPYSMTGATLILPYAVALPVLSFATDTALTDSTSVHFASFIMLVIGVMLADEIIQHRKKGDASSNADA